MVLHGAERRDLSSNAAQICKELKDMNLKWYSGQKERQQQVMKKRMEKKQSHIDHVLSLARTCKTWGGPCCSLEELKEVLKKNSELIRK